MTTRYRVECEFHPGFFSRKLIMTRRFKNSSPRSVHRYVLSPHLLASRDHSSTPGLRVSSPFGVSPTPSPLNLRDHHFLCSACSQRDRVDQRTAGSPFRDTLSTDRSLRVKMRDHCSNGRGGASTLCGDHARC